MGHSTSLIVCMPCCTAFGIVYHKKGSLYKKRAGDVELLESGPEELLTDALDAHAAGFCFVSAPHMGSLKIRIDFARDFLYNEKYGLPQQLAHPLQGRAAPAGRPANGWSRWMTGRAASLQTELIRGGQWTASRKTSMLASA